MLEDNGWWICEHNFKSISSKMAEIWHKTCKKNALVLCHIRYCLPVYGNCTKKNLGRFAKVLNFAARGVSGRRKYDHVADVRDALGWLSAADSSVYDTLVLLHRVICSEEPAALAGRFQRNEEIRERLTRQDGQLSLPRIRTESGKGRFCYRAAKQHNELPIDLQHMTNRQFKSALKRHFVGRWMAQALLLGAPLSVALPSPNCQGPYEYQGPGCQGNIPSSTHRVS